MTGKDRKTKVVSFEIKPRLIERFEEILREKGMGKSEVMRGLINQYVEKHTKKK